MTGKCGHWEGSSVTARGHWTSNTFSRVFGKNVSKCTDDPSQRPHFPVNVHSRYIQNYWSIIKLLLMKNVKLFKMKNQYYCIIMGILMIFWRNPQKIHFWVNFSIFDPLFCTQATNFYKSEWDSNERYGICADFLFWMHPNWSNYNSVINDLLEMVLTNWQWGLLGFPTVKIHELSETTDYQ